MVILSIILRIVIPILTHLMLMNSRTQVKMMMKAATRGLALLQAGAVTAPMTAQAPAAPEGAAYPTRFSAWDLRAQQLRLETHALCPCTFVNVND